MADGAPILHPSDDARLAKQSPSKPGLVANRPECPLGNVLGLLSAEGHRSWAAAHSLSVDAVASLVSLLNKCPATTRFFGERQLEVSGSGPGTMLLMLLSKGGSMVTDEQVVLLMAKLKRDRPLATTAAKAGMSQSTARK